MIQRLSKLYRTDRLRTSSPREHRRSRLEIPQDPAAAAAEVQHDYVQAQQLFQQLTGLDPANIDACTLQLCSAEIALLSSAQRAHKTDCVGLICGTVANCPA